MALDHALYRLVGDRSSPPTVRIYEWNRPSVSLGRHQRMSSQEFDRLRTGLGLTIVRRPTGGSGVLHGGDVTISVACPIDALGVAGRSVLMSHQVIMSAISDALADHGHVTRTGSKKAAGITAHPDCFTEATRCDLVYQDGLKAAGGAQARNRRAMIEQVSIPYQRHPLPPVQVFGEGSATYDGRLASLSKVGIIQALIVRLAERLDTVLEPGPWSEGERSAAQSSVDSVEEL